MTKEKNVVDWRWAVFIGVVVLGVGGYLMKTRIDFYNASAGVVGVITEIEERRVNSHSSYYPIVEYKTKTGEVFSTTGDTGSSSAFDYSIGEKVNVRYLLANSHDAKLSTFMEMWLFPFVLVVIGLLFIAAGIYNFKNTRAQKR
jgi:hypothetical protein